MTNTKTNKFIEATQKQMAERIGKPLREATSKRRESKRKAARILSGDETAWSIDIFPDLDSNELRMQFHAASAGATRQALRGLHEVAFGLVRGSLARIFPNARITVQNKNGDRVQTTLAVTLLEAQNVHRKARGLPPQTE